MCDTPLRSRPGVRRRIWRSDTSRLDLLPGVVARADERPGLDVAEAHLRAEPLELAELVGGVVAVQGQVVVRWAQVLAEGEDVDVRGAQVAHDGEHLLGRLAEAEDDARLGRDVRRRLLGEAE